MIAAGSRVKGLPELLPVVHAGHLRADVA
jgi:hypothetical protein